MSPTEPATLQLERDRRLARQVLRGDERAMRTFMDEYFPRLYRYCQHRLDNEADIDDVVQKTLSQAARKLDGFRGESTLLTWLIQICRHEISRQLKDSHRRADLMTPFLNDELLKSVVEAQVIDEESNPESVYRRTEIIGLIQFALDQLPERHAQALEWKYIEGLSSQDIAMRLGTSDEATQSLLARARRAFRDVAGTALLTAL